MAKKASVRSRVVGVRIDVETRSGTDVKFGAYRYSESPDFRMLVISYCPIREYDGGRQMLGRIRRVDPDNPDPQFVRILSDPRFEKHAFNANFERITLSRWLGMPNGTYLDPHRWFCSAVRANVSGIFGSLDEVARAVRSPITKDPEGKRLIRLFSIRDKKTGDFHGVSGNCWCGANHEKDFLKFEEYCDQDVRTEAMVAGAVPAPPPLVQREYEFDQRINDRGIRHFAGLSRQAVAQVEVERDRIMNTLKDITGLDNPNSIQQFKGWLHDQDYPMMSLDKAHREEALSDTLIPPTVANALTLKGAASLSSVQKHKAALDTRCADGRIRGSLRFYGAHTGREAGRGIQPQNLPRYEASDADRTRLIRGLAGTDAPQIAKGTVRSSLVPAKGHMFVVCDYNAIEARVLAWLAGEDWAMAEFQGAGKIYEATAATMFGVNKDKLVAALKICDKCGVCADCVTRGKGKVSNLALGYAGGAGALVTMGAESAGIDIGNYMDLHTEWVTLDKPGKFHEWNTDAHDYPELLKVRDLYRSSSPKTVSFWKQCAKAWDVSARTGNPAKFGANQVLTMLRDGRHNRLVLPNGRSIWYRAAVAHADDRNPERVDRRTFMGKSSGVGHVRTDTHGGKLTENVTQAVARDVLFDLLSKIEALTEKGWPGQSILHVHDEVVLEVPERHAQEVLDDTIGLMGEPPDWAPGLIVRGEGKIEKRYAK